MKSKYAITLLFVCISAYCTAATNLINNPGFESGLTNWNAWSGDAVDNTRAHSGSKALHSRGRGNCCLVANYNQTISVTQNTYYKYSGWIYRSDDSSWAYIDMNDRAGELQLRSEKYGEWDYVCGIWNSGSNTTVNIRCVVEKNWSTGAEVTGDIWFDDLEFSAYQESSYSEDPATLSRDARIFPIANMNAKAEIAVDGDKVYLKSLTDVTSDYKWIDGAREIKLLNRVQGNTVSWRYNSYSADDWKSVIRFASGNLELAVNFEFASEGPLHIWQTLTNLTGSTIYVEAEDIVSTDIQVDAPNNSTLWRFNRSRYNNGLDGNFTTGVLKDNIGNNFFQMCQVQNSWLVSTGELPFEVIDAGSKGLYLGYDWNFGIIKTQTQSKQKHIRLVANLGLSGEKIYREHKEVWDLPGVFIGVYSGSVDDGANQLKRWFWKNEMTASLRENEKEPLIEIHYCVYDESGFRTYLNRYNLPDLGVGLIKMDYWWTVPGTGADPGSGFDSDLETRWNPYPTKWPNGMTFGILTKDKYSDVQNSLYMCDTYLGADIANKSARDAQLEALSTRISNWKIDYWRSDFDLEKANSYASHESLLYILDKLTERHSNFRYEHCSAGGSLKDFTTLRRMTFMTMEDSGGPLNHRMAFYSNSYMINPAQLKFDVGFDWTSAADQSAIASNPRKWAKYVLRTTMMGAMMACAVGRDMLFEEFEEAKKAWNLYNEKQRPILRGADVYHILGMPDGNHWDGMEFFNQSLNKGSVFLFSHKQNGGADGTSKTIYLKGLQPNARYRLTFEDRNALSCEKYGSELMSQGINVTGFTDVFATEIIWIEMTESPTEAPFTEADKTTKPYKTLLDGQVVIINGDQKFDLSGRVKN